MQWYHNSHYSTCYSPPLCHSLHSPHLLTLVWLLWAHSFWATAHNYAWLFTHSASPSRTPSSILHPKFSCYFKWRPPGNSGRLKPQYGICHRWLKTHPCFRHRYVFPNKHTVPKDTDKAVFQIPPPSPLLQLVNKPTSKAVWCKKRCKKLIQYRRSHGQYAKNCIFLCLFVLRLVFKHHPIL